MNGAATKPKFNPRLLPPLIGLGLLLAIVLAVLFARGSRSRPTEQIETRVVRRVEQTADFTYLELEDGGDTLWLATPRVEVDVGDRVHFEPNREFRDFEVRSLKRKFDRLLSADRLYKLDADGQPVALRPASTAHGHDPMNGAHGGMGAHGGIAGHGGISGHGSTRGADVKVPQLDKAEGGHTLAEIAADPAKFSDQQVKVRGMVVWTLPGLRLDRRAMYRLQDGSGADPLPFTTTQEVEVGDLVVISGKLATDRDFGGVARYKVIVEGANVVREKAVEAKPAASGTQSETNPKDKGPKP
jgi:hypothetical protein